jgi:hypothetical protein
MPGGRGHWGRGYWGPRYGETGFSHPHGRFQTGFAGSQFWRCRWFPWLPRRWWAGIHGPMSPFDTYDMSKEQETSILKEQMKFLEEQLDQIKKRLAEIELGE